ncbi:MAG: isoprenylcysteine carboxylmethyltransferase family protein [Alphaproteobacteria bacterium]|nr:isoprenylcysteine carboxylmethyltransferase family protein [Alphaproteobacteria bacterium]
MDEISEEVKDAPKIIMLPPVLVLLHICAGLTLNWVFHGRMGHGWGWIGICMLGAAFFIIKQAKDAFEEAGTNVPPNQPALAIVTGGPFKYSRNPMYLSFMIGTAGLALLAGAPWMLLVLFPLFYLLDQRVIVPEEEYLTAKFGAVYTDYKETVRRWI